MTALLIGCLILAPLQVPAVTTTREPSRPTLLAKAAVPGIAIRGVASWFATGPDGLFAAAGPRLRAALGPRWRGHSVKVCAATCIRVTLDDWCGCPDGRLIDLSDQAFRRLAPLSRGLITVRIWP